MEETHGAKVQQCPCCGATTDGKFCKNCGQEIIEHQQTIGRLLLNITKDFFHYDGRLINTLKLLLTKPGSLTLKYVKGIRQPYIDPFKLYLSISVLAFLVCLTLNKSPKTVTKISDPEIIHLIDSARAALQADTAHSLKIKKSRYNLAKLDVNGTIVEILDPADILRHGERYYDSVQNTLPPTKKSSGYMRYKDRKFIKAYEVFDTAPYNYSKKLLDRVSLIVPKIFFISLPFFVLFLFILNLKKREQYPSAYHAIFALHFYSATWIFLTLDTIISICLEYIGTQRIYPYIGITILLGLAVYLFVAMSSFYKQRWWVTLIKSVILITTAVFMFRMIAYALDEYFLLSLDSISA